MARIDDSKPFLPVNIAVLTVSDTRTEADDKSGRATLAELIVRDGHRVAARAIVRDDIEDNRRAAEGLDRRRRHRRGDLDRRPPASPGRDVDAEASVRSMRRRSRASASCSACCPTRRSRPRPSRAGPPAGRRRHLSLRPPRVARRLPRRLDDILKWQLDSRFRPCNLVELMPTVAGAT